ncbi:MAG TPA: adenine deaminase [Gaiellaceae bacterium]|jgi:adenine deaminase|nr:adenine deaminase [Gaiellaceae bacterium]
MPDLARRLAVARGDEIADVVIEGGKVFSVFTREWLETEVAICDGYVAGLGEYAGKEVIHAGGKYVVPGLIDAHMHLETVKLLVNEFARLVLPLGTTTVVADPHEIANVLGTDGIHWLADVADEVPLDIFFMASSCVPASRFESPRRGFTLGDLQGLLRRRRVIGLAEMMNYPGVVSGDPHELGKLELESSHVDGHAPGLLGPGLQAYAAAGIRSDHECYSAEEGRQRLRAGMWVLIREATAARNLEALAPLVEEFGPHRLALCTDDREPEHIAEVGHMNHVVRRAVELGISPEDALMMATLNPALWHGLRDFGAVAPGYVADLLLLPDLESFEPDTVLKRGAPVEDYPNPAVPEWVRNTVRVAPTASNDFAIPWEGGEARVIGLIEGQIVTDELHAKPKVEGGFAVADTENDVLKIAVVERHLGTGRVGLGFVKGFGLKRGAIATSLSHDAHNIVVVGADDGDMARAVQRLAETGGGLVVINERGVQAELPLPVAGILSDAPYEEVVELSDACLAAARELGCEFPAPFQTLSFLALSVIPKLKITDRGLVDVEAFDIVPLPA